MSEAPAGRDRVFISYSHVDKNHLAQLRKHLNVYERQEQIDTWDDTKIVPGAKWKEEISKSIERARVAILLVSVDFLTSDFIQENELPPLLAAADSEGAQILIVVLRPCAFEDTGLSQFQAVNSPSKPVASLSKVGQDSVWTKVARLVRDAFVERPAAISLLTEVETKGIKDAKDVEMTPSSLIIAPNSEQSDTNNPYLSIPVTTVDNGTGNIDAQNADDLLDRGKALLKRNQLESALLIARRAVEDSPREARAWQLLGDVQYGLANYPEAIKAYDRMLELGNKSVTAHARKAAAQVGQEDYDTALSTVETALSIQPDANILHGMKGIALYFLKEYEAALESFNLALADTDVNSEVRKGLLDLKAELLDRLGRKAEADSARNRLKDME